MAATLDLGREDETEFQVPVDELAEALEVSADELVEAIESDEVGYREVGADGDHLLVEIEMQGRSCRLKIVGHE